MIESYASEVGGREVASLVSELLPVLIDKTGDNNTRIRYAAAPASCAQQKHRKPLHAQAVMRKPSIPESNPSGASRLHT